MTEERLTAIVDEIEARIREIGTINKREQRYFGNGQLDAYNACLRLLSGTNSDSETVTRVACVRAEGDDGIWHSNPCHECPNTARYRLEDGTLSCVDDCDALEEYKKGKRTRRVRE